MHIHALTNIEISPLAQYGFVSKFWTLHLDVLIYTWVSMLCLFVFVFFSNRALGRPKGYLVLVVERIVKFFDNTLQEGFGQQSPDSLSFVVGLFFFTLFCNLCGLLPFLKESTLNINTTLAIAILSFCYVQYQSIVCRRFGYLIKFFKPFFLFAPLNVVGQLAKIASLNFRLFGNIMGGAIIWDLLYLQLAKIHVIFSIASILVLPGCVWLVHQKLAPKWSFLQQLAYGFMRLVQLVPAALIVFGIFEGILHAFVVSLLTSIYINSEVDPEAAH